jgi:ABC-type antimicrobial peptide transport system permease subunit
LAKLIESNVPGAAVGYFTGLERLDWGIRETRLATVLLVVFAGLGLALAMIGLAGMALYNVTRRTPEIGIRMALGATGGNILRLILKENLSLALIGTLIGVAGSLTLTRFARAFLAASVSALDPWVFVALISTLLLTAAVAAYLPARRATKVDPLSILRQE